MNGIFKKTQWQIYSMMLIVLVFVIYCTLPSASNEKNKENLLARIPEICVYKTDCLLKDKAQLISRDDDITYAKLSKCKYDESIEDVLMYYNKQMTGHGWSKFKALQYKNMNGYISYKDDEKVLLECELFFFNDNNDKGGLEASKNSGKFKFYNIWFTSKNR